MERLDEGDDRVEARDQDRERDRVESFRVESGYAAAGGQRGVRALVGRYAMVRWCGCGCGLFAGLMSKGPVGRSVVMRAFAGARRWRGETGCARGGDNQICTTVAKLDVAAAGSGAEREKGRREGEHWGRNSLALLGSRLVASCDFAPALAQCQSLPVSGLASWSSH